MPLMVLPETLTERTGPVFGRGLIRPHDDDLTAQHQGDPIGERIFVHGRVLDEDGRPVRGALIAALLVGLVDNKAVDPRQLQALSEKIARAKKK
mgnify:CR=1 FL=1